MISEEKLRASFQFVRNDIDRIERVQQEIIRRLNLLENSKPKSFILDTAKKEIHKEDCPLVIYIKDAKLINNSQLKLYKNIKECICLH